CSVTLTGTTAGTIGSPMIVLATYTDGTVFAGSSGTTNVTIGRSTSTGVSCTTPVSVSQGSTCTVTVTDTNSGTTVNPTGTVTFSTSSTGLFSPASCSLVAVGGTI